MIALDCRGHGRSPAARDDFGRLVYSFEQMAADCAELLRALGMPWAFVCEHSNGRTVALCLAKSFRLQVRAAVVWAGNAYVDEYVRARVPSGMDPDRVDRENAAWRDAMISLHDAFRGEGYRRELLMATIAETITYPVDACGSGRSRRDGPGGARNRRQRERPWPPCRDHRRVATQPRGQVWLAEGRGHSLHWEAPDGVMERVTDFFAAALS